MINQEIIRDQQYKAFDYAYQIGENAFVELREWTSNDSIKSLTSLLNKSYKFLLDMGLNYVAATQDESVTLIRIEKAYKCFVGIYEGEIIATISLYNDSSSTNCKWYNESFVAKVGQFAVLPAFQRFGLGHKMMEIVEHEAAALENISEIALDTAETAYHLIKYYEKRGYRYIETIKWDVTNYKSVVMSKSLEL